MDTHFVLRAPRSIDSLQSLSFRGLRVAFWVLPLFASLASCGSSPLEPVSAPADIGTLAEQPGVRWTRSEDYWVPFSEADRTRLVRDGFRYRLDGRVVITRLSSASDDEAIATLAEIDGPATVHIVGARLENAAIRNRLRALSDEFELALTISDSGSALPLLSQFANLRAPYQNYTPCTSAPRRGIFRNSVILHRSESST